MASSSIPGPLGSSDHISPFDEGTLAKRQSPTPGPISGLPLYLSQLGSKLGFSKSPSGDAARKSKSIQQYVANSITGGAELAHEYFEFAVSSARKHPWILTSSNDILRLLRRVLSRVVDTNPKTMGWNDLGAIWLFELGTTSQIEFPADSRLTKDLMNEDGVNLRRTAANARLLQMRNANCQPALETITKSWTYGQKQFYEGITSLNLATSFTGSYNVSVDINCNKQTLKFRVSNTTGWASGTRLRKASKSGGIHQAIIPDRQRGDPGVELGGNITQIWTWEESADKMVK